MDNGNGNGAGSHLAWIRRRHEELSTERTMDRAVPGYAGRLVLRFRPVPWSVVVKVQTLIANGEGDASGRAALNANCDVLIAACAGVFMDGEPIDPSGDVRRIDPDLAELLGSGTNTARETLLWLFPNELAVSMMAGEVLQWTSAASTEVAEDLVGE